MRCCRGQARAKRGEKREVEYALACEDLFSRLVVVDLVLGRAFDPRIASDCWHVVVNVMPYLTNNHPTDWP